MPSDIVKEDIRDAWRSYTEIPTPPRAKVVIDYVPELLDELDVKDERIQEQNQQVDVLTASIEDLEHELKVANAKIQEIQRGPMPEPEVEQDHQDLLEASRVAFDDISGNRDQAYTCLAAIPPLLAENARLRRDSEALRKLLDAAALFVGMLERR